MYLFGITANTDKLYYSRYSFILIYLAPYTNTVFCKLFNKFNMVVSAPFVSPSAYYTNEPTNNCITL